MNSRILLVADSTSQLRPGWLVAKALADSLELQLRCNIVPNQSISDAGHLRDVGVDVPTSHWSIPELVEQPDFFEYGVVVVFLAASRIFRLRRQVELSLARRTRPSRPLLVTGYNGVVFEKHLEGLAWRLGYDFICVNSERDERIFSDCLNLLGQSTNALVRTGLPLAQLTAPPSMQSEATASGSLLFATQHIVPWARRERVYLVRALARLALARPDRKVIIKPRSAPGEQTLHKEKYHYATLLQEEVKRPPPNLLVQYGPLSEFLPSTAILATVSSTAALEAISCGVPAAVLTDLGVKESLGNHFFAGSGLFSTIPNLHHFRPPSPDGSWLSTNGLGGNESLSSLATAVGAAVREQANSSIARPLVPSYYGPTTAPGIDQLVMWSTPERGSRILPEAGPRAMSSHASEQPTLGARVRSKLRQALRPRFVRNSNSDPQ